MLRESLTILIWTMVTSSLSLPLHHEVVDTTVNAVSKDNYLYLIILHEMEYPDYGNKKIVKEDDEYFAMPIPLFPYRRQNLRPSVEVGPGAFKPEIVQYPPDLLKQQLNKLMKLKEKIEKRNKDLNARRRHE